MISQRTLISTLIVTLFLLIAGPAFAGSGDEWRPVTPAELASKTPVVEPNADAEYIFWEVKMDDSDISQKSLNVYARLKIYTDRGREQFAKIDIPSRVNSTIKDVTARVIKPDGTIIDIKKEDIFDRTIVKLGKGKIKAKSFAVPGIAAGVVIEYRFREVLDGIPFAFPLYFQREIPTQTCTYYVRPNQEAYGRQQVFGLKEEQFHMPAGVKFVKDKGDYYRATVSNVPSMSDEPYMPPVDELRSWVMVYYNFDDESNPDAFWKTYNREYNDLEKESIKPNDDVKRMANDLTAGAQTPEEKLAKLYEFCQTKIVNVTYDSSLSKDDKAKIKENKSAGETLHRLKARETEIDELFAALANALGLEAHAAVTGFRDDLFFNHTMANRYLVHQAFIAVKVGDGWRFFNPGNPFIPYGVLAWTEDGQETLIINSGDPIWVKAPLSTTQQTQEKRTGKFRLSEDGTLEGTVRIEYSGQLSLIHKLDNYEDSVVEQEKTLTDDIKSRLSTAELSNIKIENINDPLKPFAYSFNLRVPGYAQKTGKRLFFQPGFFEHGGKSAFTAAERKYDLYFEYPWSQEDDIYIDLPAGYALDNPEQPAAISPEQTGGIAGLDIRMGLSKDQKTLRYVRSFFFGGKGTIYFPKTAYPSVKKMFDVIRQEDDQAIALRQP